MQKIAGLDIGSTSIKIVEVKPDKGGLRLFAADFIPTPPRGIMSESDVDQQLLIGTIKKLVNLAKIDTTTVNISLSENQIFTRVIQMPDLTDKELTSAIKYESEQYIPLPVASVSLDWEVLTRDKEKNRMEVLLVGAPTALITKYQKIVQSSGLEIVSIETEILASSHSLILEQEKTTPTVIVDIGSSSCDLGIFRDGLLVVSYTIPTGGAALTRAIEQEFGFSPTQAEQYKVTYGVDSSALDGKIFQAVKPVLLAIIIEIKKAINFYQTKYQDSKLQRIILSGGNARLAGLAPFFVDNLGIETEIANPWKTLVVDENLFKVALQNPSIYATATGLALKTL